MQSLIVLLGGDEMRNEGNLENEREKKEENEPKKGKLEDKNTNDII